MGIGLNVVVESGAGARAHFSDDQYRGAGADVAADDILAFCRESLADFKMPKQIIFRDALPKNLRGKLDRTALLEDWKRSHAGSVAPAAGE